MLELCQSVNLNFLLLASLSKFEYFSQVYVDLIGYTNLLSWQVMSANGFGTKQIQLGPQNLIACV